jgi:hypothetical protein
MATVVVRELLGNPVFNLIHFGPVNPQKRFSVGDILLADRPLRDSQNINQVVGTLTIRGMIIREIPPDDVLGGFNVEARSPTQSGFVGPATGSPFWARPEVGIWISPRCSARVGADGPP